MAISYPRELPSYRLTDGSIDLVANVSMSPSGKGAFMNLTQVSDPVWRGRFVTIPMPLGQDAAWVSWATSLRGGFRSFIAHDPRHKQPLAYRSAQAPADIAAGWGGTGTVAALGTGGVLSLTGLPTSYQITAGDRIGIEQGGRRGYYEALESVTATGGEAAVTVAPFLHTSLFGVGALARLWRPACEFTIDWQSWSQTGEANFPGFSFEAWQKL